MEKIDYQCIFQEIVAEIEQLEDKGEAASYIPELGNVDSTKFGIHLMTNDGDDFCFGDSNQQFSIQSIAKVLSLTLALKLHREKLWERVGVEPSGSAFNSLVLLEYEKGVPRNPFINAGAIVICDILVSSYDDPKHELLQFIRKLSANENIEFCEQTVVSESEFGFRNRALANLMKDFGNIKNDVEVVLELYFNLCSIKMTCKDLAQTFMFLASEGKIYGTGEQIVTPRQAKRINSIMLTCGFYDEAGEFAFKVGLPGKSGVGGGIVAIHPGMFSIAVWSPKLNSKGNSYKGMKVLEAITTKTRLSIF